MCLQFVVEFAILFAFSFLLFLSIICVLRVLVVRRRPRSRCRLHFCSLPSDGRLSSPSYSPLLPVFSSLALLPISHVISRTLSHSYDHCVYVSSRVPEKEERRRKKRSTRRSNVRYPGPILPRFAFACRSKDQNNSLPHSALRSNERHTILHTASG